jgi:uncharacterized membrane protein
MAKAEVSATINRSVEDVFAVLSNVENTPKWSSNALEERMTSKGPVGVGSTRRAVVRSFGRTTENEAEVTEFEPNRRIALRAISGPFPFRVSIDFEPVAGGTRVDWTWEWAPRGFLNLAGPLVGFFTRQFRKDLNTLKDMMEAGAL